MKYLYAAGIVGRDMQKKGKPRLPTSGGLCVGAGLITGLMFYIMIDTFLGEGIGSTLLLAITCSILIAILIGLLDDIGVRRKKEATTGIIDYRVGLKQWQKPLFLLAAAVPLVAIRAGVSSMTLPFLGRVEFGIVYPLVLVPIGFVCVTNAVNMLAGANGLEAGLGLVACFFLAYYSFLIGSLEASILASITAAACLAFLFFNKYPAKILPGDSLTYLIGSVFASAVIIGNMEKFGILLFIPWIMEAFLKLRSRFKATSLGKLRRDGTLKAPYQKIYSLNHLVMKAGKFKEWEIVLMLISIEVAIGFLALFLCLGGMI
jgi:UDP-N-acetylglucosamine--dolichyl-phosphate N-acetylglucosaminephosphotransferase